MLSRITKFHRAILVMTVLVANSVVIFLLVYALNEARQQKEREIRTTVENLALEIDHNITASADKIDLTLREIADELDSGLRAGGRLDGRKVSALVTARRAWLSELAEVRVIDASGVDKYGSGSAPGSNLNYSDREFFRVHRTHSDSGLIVTKPRLGRIFGIWAISFTRRYNYPDGSFAGVISAAVPVSYFGKLLSGPDLGRHGVALLRDEDAGLIARAPADQAAYGRIGSKIMSNELGKIINSGAAARTYHSAQNEDGIERTDAYRRLSAVPFQLVVGLAAEDYLADWRSSVKKAVATVAVFLVFSTAFGWLLWKSFGLVESAGKRRKLLLRRASSGIHILDNKGNIVEAGDAFCRMLGYSQSEVVGMHAAQWEANFTPDELARIIARHFECDDVSTFETRHRCKDGSIIEVEVTGYTMELDGQPVIRYASRDISERNRMEEQLRKLAQAVEQSPVSIVITDREGKIEYVNSRFTKTTGYSQKEAIGQNPRILQSDETPGATYEKLWRCLLDGKEWRGLFRNRRKNGELFWEEASISPILNDQNEITHFVAVKEDITERKLAEQRLHLAASVFTGAREGISITDPDGTILEVNDAFTRITGYRREEVVGQNPRMLSSNRHGKEFYAGMWYDLIEKGHWNGEIWNRRKNGEVYAQMATISAVRDDHGNTRQYVALFSDISELKNYQKQLEHIAHYDALTGLPNRVLLANRLQQAMAQTKRRGQRLAVVYLDLDGFKAINDSHGHEVGDQLLMTVASRMKRTLRSGDTIARIGGDEFVAVLLDLADSEASVPMLNRLLAAASLPVQVDRLVNQVSASLGVTFFPQAEDVDADQLLRQADQVMYQAKQAGKNRYHIFDAEQDRSVRGHHESVEHIRLALTKREFVLYYQPKVNMRSGKIIGAEALIRWRHPERGLLAPAIFLPVIENHVLAIELGEWVIDSALAQMTAWRAAGLSIPVSVNVGAMQLQQADFMDRLRQIVSAYPDIRSGDLELEVLETSALEDLAHISQVINECREIGVNFALDDFGTGYSSLTYLKWLPVTQLKIDQSFVRNMLDDPDDLAILEGVLGLATAFRRQVIAEGVETVELGEMLLQLGCELAQGYCIARPMPADEMPSWVAAWRPDPAWSDRPAISRDDIPLLFASVEHRAWIASMGYYLKGEREDTPPLDLHQCRFGAWLDTDGHSRYGARPAFQRIEPLHGQVHTLAAELCELKADGRTPEAVARLHELQGLRDALLEHLKELLGVFE